MKATANDLRLITKELLEAIARGEEVLITYRGEPVAKLVPVKEENSSGVKNKPELFGMWADYEDIEPVEGFVRRIRGGDSNSY